MDAFNWSAHPAVRCALAYAAGLTIASTGAVTPAVALVSLACSAVLMVLNRRTRSIAAGVALVLVTASAGALTMALSAVASSATPSNFATSRVDCVGTVVEAPRKRRGAVEMLLETDSIVMRSETARVRCRALVRVDDTTWPSVSPGAGDRVSVLGSLRAPRSAIMPGSFDERAYLASRAIDMTLAVDDAASIHVTRERGVAPVAWLVEVVRARVARFARDHVGGREGAVVEALLDGERGGIDSQTKQAFASTGTLHVLAVSGLHVAVIALGLSVMTSWLPGRRRQFIVFALVLGAYAVIAGAGASILRAWCMAVCFMLARVAGRRARSLNVLSASALMLMVISPESIFDAGFQLSFAAVGGLTLYHARWSREIDEAWPKLRDHTALNWMIRSLMVTVSAQLLTLPILMAHFGSVPALGLLLNLPVVPLTSCAMAASAIGVLSSPVPYLAGSFGATAYVTTRIAVALVEWGATLPFASLAVRPLPALTTAIAVVLIAAASRAHSARSSLLRLALSAVAVVLLVRATGDADDTASTRAYIVPTQRGLIVASFRDDSLAVAVAGDTLGSSARIDDLARGLGAAVTRRRHLRAVPLATARTRRHARADAPDRDPRSVLVASGIPIVVDSSRAHARQASLEGVPVLVVGERSRPARTLAFEYDHRWTSIVWH